MSAEVRLTVGMVWCEWWSFVACDMDVLLYPVDAGGFAFQCEHGFVRAGFLMRVGGARLRLRRRVWRRCRVVRGWGLCRRGRCVGGLCPLALSGVRCIG